MKRSSPEKSVEPAAARGGNRSLITFLKVLAVGAAAAGIGVTFLLPSQIFRPAADRAWDRVKGEYSDMIDEGLKDLPTVKTAFADREECWTGGKTVCVYGWYMEMKKGARLVSYTLADEADEKRGVMRGWWWEVDTKTQAVRPVWVSVRLRREYGLALSENLLGPGRTSKEIPARPTAPPLLKTP